MVISDLTWAFQQAKTRSERRTGGRPSHSPRSAAAAAASLCIDVAEEGAADLFGRHPWVMMPAPMACAVSG